MHPVTAQLQLCRIIASGMFWWTYNSNAIEGNTLTLRETELVVNRGLTIGGKTLREHFEALNHAEAIARSSSSTRKRSPDTQVIP